MGQGQWVAKSDAAHGCMCTPTSTACLPACLRLPSQMCPHLNCDSIHLVQSPNCSLTKGTEWLRSGRPLRKQFHCWVKDGFSSGIWQ